MNCYGLPDNERDYYRLAHEHRTFLNKVPYHHSGDVDPGCAPAWDGKRLDWAAWDKRFGPYFDGSAFADLPRKGVPLEGFYLPLFENWPTPPGPAAESGPIKVLQGRDAVRNALIDPKQPDRKLGGEARSNAVSKGDESGAFLVYFDLDRLSLPKGAKTAKATLSFYVWDPSSQGNTKVCAFPLKTAWEEASATWDQPADGKAWKGGKTFSLPEDAGAASPPVVVKPDMGSDTIDPPLEYQLDVTDMVRAWLDGAAPNHGLAIVPLPDQAVDDGFHTRFQLYASEYNQAQYTPKLTVVLEK